MTLVIYELAQKSILGIEYEQVFDHVRPPLVETAAPDGLPRKF